MIEAPFKRMNLSYKQLANLDELIEDMNEGLEKNYGVKAEIRETLGFTNAIHETTTTFNAIFEDEENYAMFLLQDLQYDEDIIYTWEKYQEGII